MIVEQKVLDQSPTFLFLFCHVHCDSKLCLQGDLLSIEKRVWTPMGVPLSWIRFLVLKRRQKKGWIRLGCRCPLYLLKICLILTSLVLGCRLWWQWNLISSFGVMLLRSFLLMRLMMTVARLWFWTVKDKIVKSILDRYWLILPFLSPLFLWKINPSFWRNHWMFSLWPRWSSILAIACFWAFICIVASNTLRWSVAEDFPFFSTWQPWISSHIISQNTTNFDRDSSDLWGKMLHYLKTLSSSPCHYCLHIIFRFSQSVQIHHR